MIDSLRGLVVKAGAVCALGLAGLLAGPAAHADMVLGGNAFIADEFRFDASFDLGSSGSLSVRVSDLGVPLTLSDQLDSLTFYVGDEFGRILDALDHAGTLEMWIEQPGRYTLFLFAMPSTKLGLLSWEADFTRVAAVPLPPALWLLLAGSAWAMGLQRRRAKLAH